MCRKLCSSVNRCEIVKCLMQSHWRRASLLRSLVCSFVRFLSLSLALQLLFALCFISMLIHAIVLFPFDNFNTHTDTYKYIHIQRDREGIPPKACITFVSCDSPLVCAITFHPLFFFLFYHSCLQFSTESPSIGLHFSLVPYFVCI